MCVTKGHLQDRIIEMILQKVMWELMDKNWNSVHRAITYREMCVGMLYIQIPEVGDISGAQLEYKSDLGTTLGLDQLKKVNKKAKPKTSPIKPMKKAGK